MSRSIKSAKSGLLLDSGSSKPSPGSSTASGRRKSVALRAGSFDEQQLLRAEQASRGGSQTPPQSTAANATTHSSPKFFRTQSFGDRLLASASPKFGKSKKMFHSIGPKSSSSTVLFFPPEPSPSAKASGSGFGCRRLQNNADGSAARPQKQPSLEHDPLGAYREELRQLRQLQKERFRSRSSSISIERWNESASGQRREFLANLKRFGVMLRLHVACYNNASPMLGESCHHKWDT
uniref:Uncharacterized protein n=1 Tax=Anopheles farauti TaxID=69004 RepID=A0A182QIA5_9DIPT